jgi:DNA-binding transcriptional MerR regulator
MKKVLPQISLDFGSEPAASASTAAPETNSTPSVSAAPPTTPSPQPPAERIGEPPSVEGAAARDYEGAGVTVRIKSLKTASPASTSQAQTPPAQTSHAQTPLASTSGDDLPARIHASRKATAVLAKSKRGRKSLKQVAAEADLIDIPSDEVLFSKQYYTMGEVSGMFRVNQSLLRFWETEFDILQPRKNKKGDRYFRPADIKNLHLIYHLLRQRKYTIEGAKEFLKKNKKAKERFEAIQRLQEIRDFLVEWKASLTP